MSKLMKSRKLFANLTGQSCFTNFSLDKHAMVVTFEISNRPFGNAQEYSRKIPTVIRLKYVYYQLDSQFGALSMTHPF